MLWIHRLERILKNLTTSYKAPTKKPVQLKFPPHCGSGYVGKLTNAEYCSLKCKISLSDICLKEIIFYRFLFSSAAFYNQISYFLFLNFSLIMPLESQSFNSLSLTVSVLLMLEITFITFFHIGGFKMLS